jgi:hypothetical protein
MLAPVHEYVDDRVAHFARGRQRTCMVPIAPNAASPDDHAVHGARQADAQSDDATGEGDLVTRLDEQVDVVALNREVQDSKPAASRARQRAVKRSEHALLPQARDSWRGSERDVDGVSFAVRGPSMVRYAATRGYPLSPGSVSLSAPGAEGELALDVSPFHMNSA